MITLAEDSNNDLTLGLNGSLSIDAGVQAVLRVLRAECETQLGELVFDATRGIPNFAVVWSGQPSVAQYEAALRATATKVAGVVSVESVTATVNNNVLSYSMVVRTIYGLGSING